MTTLKDIASDSIGAIRAEFASGFALNSLNSFVFFQEKKFKKNHADNTK
jgi:hypothetical protein